MTKIKNEAHDPEECRACVDWARLAAAKSANEIGQLAGEIRRLADDLALSGQDGRWDTAGTLRRVSAKGDRR